MTHDLLEELRAKLLDGRVVVVRYMYEDELEDLGWDTRRKVIILALSSGHYIYAAIDEELNAPGELVIS